MTIKESFKINGENLLNKVKELVENGVYVYRILVTDYHNLKHTFVGHVSVVR